MDRLEAFTRLRAGPVMRLFAENDVLRLVSLSQLIRVEAGTRFQPSAPHRFVYLVLSGEVVLANKSGSRVGRLREGNLIELTTVLGKVGAWEHDWLADGPVEIVEIPAEELLRLIRRTRGVETYLNRILFDPSPHRLANDLRLCGFASPQVVQIIAALKKTNWMQLMRSSDSGQEGLLLVLSGQIDASMDYGNRVHAMGPFSSGDYFIYRPSEILKLEATMGTEVYFLPRKTWEDLSGRDQVATFAALADPIATKQKALRRALDRRKTTFIGAEVLDDEVENASVSDFKCTDAERKKLRRKKRRVILQHDELDCGAACLATIARFYGKRIDVPAYRSLVHVTRDGASMLALKRAAEKTGFLAMGAMAGYEALTKVRAPFIALMQYHFIVVYQVNDRGVVASDPATGLVKIDLEQFVEEWSGSVLLLKPTDDFHQQKESRPAFLKYGSLLSGSFRSMAEIFGSSLLMFLLGLALPVFLQYVVDAVVPTKRPEALTVALFGLALLLLLQNLMEWIRSHLLIHLTSRLDGLFSALFVRRLLGLPLSFFSVRTVGDITKRMAELVNIRDVLLGKTVALLTVSLGAAINLVVIGIYSPKLVIALLTTLILPALFILLLAPQITKRLRKLYAAEGVWQSKAWEQFHGLNTIKSLGGQIAARWRFNIDLFKSLRMRRSLGLYHGLTMAASDFFELFLSAVLLLSALYLYTRGELSLGHVLAVTFLGSFVIGAVMTVLESWYDLNDVGVSMGRVDDVITAAPERTGKKNEDVALTGLVELSQVSFQYGSELSPQALDEVSLTITPGETVALVGASGSGKTTMGYLFNLLYRPSAGRILFDGVDSEEIALSSLRRQVAMIVQDNSIFSGSILENIALGDPHPSFERVVEAARAADAHEFITAISEGYSTHLGESGEGLSGGQMQRINIARALYRNPKILIMDEATSALDAISEARIVKNLRARKGTTIVIAHRLNTVMHADRIIVLSKGRITESGTHQELLAHGGDYHQLFAHQLAI